MTLNIVGFLIAAAIFSLIFSTLCKSEINYLLWTGLGALLLAFMVGCCFFYIIIKKNNKHQIKFLRR